MSGDEELVRRCELLATGANIHGVRSLVGGFRDAEFLLARALGEPTEPGRMVSLANHLAMRRRALEWLLQTGEPKDCYRRARMEVVGYDGRRHVSAEAWQALPDDNCPCDAWWCDDCTTCRGDCACHWRKD